MDELEDFEDIESSGTNDDSLDLSNVFNIKIGGFGDSDDLKTYFGSISIDELEEDISLYETLTKDKSWPVSQIIQREVNKFRVSDISKSYILGTGRLIKYFPPLIIAILPKEHDGKIGLELDFHPDDSSKTKEAIYDRSKYHSNEKIKPYIVNAPNISLIDGLYVLEVSKVFDTRLLSWDKNKYYAVVIDGQHRLEALFKSKEENEKVGKHQQDVVFIDFSPIVKRKPQHTPVEVVRRIFIDINTNAQRVGFVRQVLMDDKDLASLCIQSLVDSSNPEGSNKNQDSFLRSQLVDWYGDKLKHSLPHLTGVLSLYQIIDDFFIKDSLSSLRDRRSPKKVQNWVSRLNTIFMIDQELEDNENYRDTGIIPLYKSLKEYDERIAQNNELSEELDDEYKESEIFEYDYRVLDIARDQFEKIYARPLIKFFNDIKPHSKTIAIIEEEGGFGENENLSSALIASRKKIAYTKTYKDSLRKLKAKIEAELHSNYFLLFSVLGQKVLFNNLFQRYLAEINSDFDEEECFEITDNYLSNLNSLLDFTDSKPISLFARKEEVIIQDVPEELIDLGIISSSFWEGIIYEGNRIIYNTQGIRTLSDVLNKLLGLNYAKSKDEEIIFDLGSTPYVKSRISRMLNRRFEYSESEIESYSKQVIELKNQFIINYFS
ncbi:DNA sulfur modification protein DndB [uncultured Christiangramia sp.]|uniref:DNA sulfur modification protein DndB n=1 Tax=Christiangramia sp. 3-2217-3z TaxID=3417564 RepID=UPI00260F79DA|nr:DNA sulfur modification protein DndB [uncultured Christiangramia sp.]